MRIILAFILSAFISGAFALSAASPESGIAPAFVGTLPPLGYVLDRDIHALRPILGIPGSAIVGPPVEVGVSIADVVIDGAGEYAVAISGGAERQAYLIHLAGQVSITQIPIFGRASAAYVSPAGTAAAVVTEEASIAFLTGMSAKNPVVRQFQVGRQPKAAAISDDGSFVLAAFGGAQDLQLLGRDGSAINIQAPGSISALAFRPSSYDALAAGPDNIVWLIQQANSSPSFLALAGPNDGIAAPAALAVTLDGKQAVVANSAGQTISVVDLRNGTIRSAVCSCVPVRLERLTSPGFFRINDLSDRPLFIMNAASGRVLFVPPSVSRAPVPGRAR